MKQSVIMGVFVASFLVLGLAVAAAGPVAAQELPANVDVPSGVELLGTINLPSQVMADGQRLLAGDYEVRLTAESATPATIGALTELERWVEFRQGDAIRGREVVTIVPGSEIGDVAKSAVPDPGVSRVEVLRENEFIRVWINHDGTHFLIHLVVG